MKKFALIILALIFVLSGCSKPAQETENRSEEPVISEEPLQKPEEVPKENVYKNADTTFPENLYDMTPESFEKRENDKYITYLYKVLSSTNWPAVTGISYSEYFGLNPLKISAAKSFITFFALRQRIIMIFILFPILKL